MAVELELQDPLERVKDVWEDTKWLETNYDYNLRPYVRPHTSTLHPSTSSVLATTTFLLTISPLLCNRSGSLHGGAAATVFDLCTSLALAPLASPGLWTRLGVSRGLSVTYLRPAPAGATVLVVCEVVGVGRRLASVRGYMREWDGEGGEARGPRLCECAHEKVNTDSPVKGGEKL